MSVIFRTAFFVLVLFIVTSQASTRSHTKVQQSCLNISQKEKLDLRIISVHCFCHCMDKPDYLYDCKDVKYKFGPMMCETCRKYLKCAKGKTFM